MHPCRWQTLASFSVSSHAKELLPPLQALEEWDPASFERCLEPIEDALGAAAQDALAETRTAGRAALAAYARARPDRLPALLPRLQPGLRARLAEALAAPAAAGARAEHPLFITPASPCNWVLWSVP
jgi:hypothetical protein